MKYQKTRFLLSAPSIRLLPQDQIPEVAFIGRSNAGKSSALNALTGQKQLAKSSKEPGRTQYINLFQLEDQLRFVDLPGYGFSKASKQVQQRYKQLRSEYLLTRTNLIGLVLLMDIRHPFQPLDIELLKQLRNAEIGLTILLTKADKLSASKRQRTLAMAAAELQHDYHCGIIPFSSTQGLGIIELREQLEKWYRENLQLNHQPLDH